MTGAGGGTAGKKKKVDFTWSVCYAHTLLAAAMPHQGEKTVQGFILVL